MVATRTRSKKRSDANSTKSPLNDITFFIDCSLGRNIVPEMLRSAGEKIIAHDNIFPQGTKDEIWLSEAGKNGWIVLTKDKMIRYHKTEINVMVECKVGAVVLASQKGLQGKEIGELFCKFLPAIKRFCNRVERPFIVKLLKDGSLIQIYPPNLPYPHKRNT